jgi:uncharacterized protein YutE (UPF0331/DUF86 family)
MKEELRFNRIPNMIKKLGPQVFEKEEKEYLNKNIHNFIKRESELPSYFTNAGIYSTIMEEARECYKYGFFYATITLIGVSSEKFSCDLEKKLTKKINKNKLDQYKKLILLKKSKIISSKEYNNLNKIRELRNQYIHIKKKLECVKKEALEIIKLFNNVLEEEFNKKYVIKNGKLKLRKTSK